MKVELSKLSRFTIDRRSLLLFGQYRRVGRAWARAIGGPTGVLSIAKLRARPVASFILLAAPLVFFAEVNFAHHSVFANFDTRSSSEVTGIVKVVDIRNPHSHYVLDVPGDDGGSEEWLIEWSDRNALIRRQVALDRIKVGDEVTIVLWPSRRLDRVGFFVQATLPDGSIFRDCGFGEFREAVVNSKEFSCPEAGGEQ